MMGHITADGAVQEVHGVLGVTHFKTTTFPGADVCCAANYIIPEHTHPNVDSFELYLGGQIMFSHLGKWVATSGEVIAADRFGQSLMRGSSIRVKPDDLHGGCFGPSGGVFMSIQHWLNDTMPSCVSKDYDGIALAAEHTTTVGNLEHKELTWRDAARGGYTSALAELRGKHGVEDENRMGEILG